MKSVSVFPVVLRGSSQQPHEADFIKIALEKVRLMSRDVKSLAQGCTVSEEKQRDVSPGLWLWFKATDGKGCARARLENTGLASRAPPSWISVQVRHSPGSCLSPARMMQTFPKRAVKMRHPGMLPADIPYSLSSHSGDCGATHNDSSQHTSIHVSDEVEILSEVRQPPSFWETEEAGSCGEHLALSHMSMGGSEGNRTRRCRHDCGLPRAQSWPGRAVSPD